MKTKKRKQEENHGATAAQSGKTQAPKTPPPSRRWRLLLLLSAVAIAGATWAFFEFVVWAKVPPELVGKWKVVEGPEEYKDATFEFFRNGTMEGEVNVKEVLHIIKATIRVEGKKIFATSKHPRTGKEEVQVQIIRSVTEKELIVEDEQGKLMKMKRAAS